MKYLLSLVALFWVAIAVGIAQEGDHELVIVDEKMTVLDEIPSPQQCDRCERKGLLKRLFGRRQQPPRGAKPFEDGRYRYEPRIRDIRLIRSSFALPGHDSGIPETLPVIPPRQWGYFVLPLDPVRK